METVFNPNVTAPDLGLHSSLNFISAKKQTTKFISAKISIIVLSSCIILRIKRLDDNQCKS